MDAQEETLSSALSHDAARVPQPRFRKFTAILVIASAVGIGDRSAQRRRHRHPRKRS